MKNVRGRGGTGKLKLKVVSKSEDLPVYKVKPIGTYRVRTVHRNLIKLCNELAVDVFKRSMTAEKPQEKKLNNRKMLEKRAVGEEGDDDSEDDLITVHLLLLYKRGRG